MNKPKFMVIKFKKLIIPFSICLFAFCLIIFSKDNLYAAKSGLSLWANSVVPSLLPFFIATNLLSYTKVVSFLGQILNKIMRPLFNIPGEGAFPFIMGIISGYPIGAKIISDFKEQDIATSIECERLLSFTNNSGPLFIVGTVGASLFYDTKTGILLLITHVLACITVGVLFRWWKSGAKYAETDCIRPGRCTRPPQYSTINSSNLGEILAKSIMDSINTIILIGGFIVLFSVIISILSNSKIIFILSTLLAPILSIFRIPSQYASGLITGIFELTNGVSVISSIPNKTISINIVLCSFLIGFGGISVLLQVLSITSKSKISIKPYIIGKLLQASFAALYTFLILQNFSFFNLDL